MTAVFNGISQFMLALLHIHSLVVWSDFVLHFPIGGFRGRVGVASPALIEHFNPKRYFRSFFWVVIPLTGPE